MTATVYRDCDTWVYRGVYVTRAGINGSGIRWYAVLNGQGLRAGTKDGMRDLIRRYSTRT